MPELGKIASCVAKKRTRCSCVKKGMERLWRDSEFEITKLMQEMAVYFSKFKIVNSKNNLYVKIINEINENDILKETVLSTINYDCLIESALEKLKIEYIYNIANNSYDKPTFLKIHGSCNFIPNPNEIKTVKNTLKYSGSKVFWNPRLVPIKPEEVESFCRNSDLYPGIAIYMKSKPVRIGSPTIDLLQKNWQRIIGNAEKVFIIGVNPNIEDHHIWNYIHKKDQVFYCGCKSSFKKWQRDQGRNDIFLDYTFENSIEDIIKYSLN